MMVREVLQRGADPNRKIFMRGRYVTKKNTSEDFLFPVHFAASRGEGWVECLQELLACARTSVDAFDSEGSWFGCVVVVDPEV